MKETIDELNKSLVASVGDLVATVNSIKAQIAEITKSISTVTEEVTSVKGNFDEFGKRVDELEDATAIRKSGDLGGVVQETKIQKRSMWGGRFLNSADLYR
jgi:flagellar hook-associated protein FlgK